jgi:hypothetical protein
MVLHIVFITYFLPTCCAAIKEERMGVVEVTHANSGVPGGGGVTHPPPPRATRGVWPGETRAAW